MTIKTSEYRERIKQLVKSLRPSSGQSKAQQTGAIVLPTADCPIKSHDQQHPYFQDRDFLYFTGAAQLRGAALVITSANTPPQLLIQKPSAKQRQWDGPGALDKKSWTDLGVNVVETNSFATDLRQAVRGSDAIYLNPARSLVAQQLATSLLEMPLYELQSNQLPCAIYNSQLLTAPLRAVKSPAEIQMIRNAVSLTESALIEVLRVTRPGCTEIQLARLFDGLVREAGGNLGFQTIVASGPNAAVLHHAPSARKLKKGELVLFDVGAELDGYNGDISRTVSLGAPEHVDHLLTVVDAAQEQIARLLKVGRLLSDIKRDATKIMAAHILKSGLPGKGSVDQFVKSGAVREFFPHSFGHSLGLDVHDPIAPDAKLTSGMVFTVEPGIYLTKKLGKYPPLGIRIEDDFFVSATGPKIFSSIPQLLSI